MGKGESESKERALPVEVVDRWWMIGIAWSSTCSLYGKGSQRTDAEERTLRHFLSLVLNTFREVKLEDTEVARVLNQMETEVSGKQPPTLTKKELDEILPDLRGAVRAKSPHYYGIFGSAENASKMKTAFSDQAMEGQRSAFADFLRFFHYLRPVLPREDYAMIAGGMTYWDGKWEKYRETKRKPRLDGLDYLECSIHDILVGAAEATDFLGIWDRILIAFFAGAVILTTGTILFAIVAGILQFALSFILIKPTLPFEIKQAQDLLGGLKDTLTVLGAFGAATAGVGRAVWRLTNDLTTAFTRFLTKTRFVHQGTAKRSRQ